jgi:predicted secreted hydrolase
MPYPPVRRPMTWLARLGLGGFVGILILAGVGSLLLAPRGGETTAPRDADQGAVIEALVASLDDGPASAVSGPWDLDLPSDYGAHPDAPTETWSVVAHLEDPEGRPLAVNLVLTRVGRAGDEDAAANLWGPGPVHIAQATIIAADPGLRASEERISRARGAAGHDAATGEIWLDDWTLTYGDDALDLTLRLSDQFLRLRLEPRKTPLAPTGDDTAGPRGFAIPRLEVVGTVETAGTTTALGGSAWLDRLWGEIPLPGGPLVRDRLVLHLSDGAELSLLQTRRRDGRGIATVNGVLVAPDGGTTLLDDATVDLTSGPLQEDSAMPGSWRIAGAGLDLQVTLLGASGQEDFALPVRVGHLVVEGTRQGMPVEGAGTVLLSGSDGT